MMMGDFCGCNDVTILHPVAVSELPGINVCKVFNNINTFHYTNLQFLKSFLNPTGHKHILQIQNFPESYLNVFFPIFTIVVMLFQ